MDGLTEFICHFQKSVLKHISFFIKNNNFYLSREIQNLFYYTFYKKQLLTSSALYNLFSIVKQLPPQINVIIRQEYVRYTYFPLCWENIIFLKKYLTSFEKLCIYELAAGNGWLSYYLIKYGINIKKIIDDFSWEKLNETEKPIKVYKQDAIKTIKDEKPNVILINWPPPEKDFLLKIFNALKQNNYLIIIADKDYKVSGNEIFFKNYEKYLLLKEKLPYSFPNLQDILYIYLKK